jgi:hypothetical protein
VSSAVHNEAKLMDTLQVPNVAETFPAVSHPHLDRETCPWEIDSARTSALAQIKSDFRSKSTSCLVREGDNIPDENHSPLSNLKIIVKKVRRKSHEVEEPYKSDKKKSKKTSLTGGLHRRCHSAVGLSRQDAFDSNDEERNRAAAFEALKYIEKNNNVYSSADSALEQNQDQQQPKESLEDKSNTFPRQAMPHYAPQPSPKSSKSEKSSTFPRQMTLHSSSPAASSQANMGKKFMKSMSLMSSPVKHFSHFLSPPSRANDLTSSSR